MGENFSPNLSWFHSQTQKHGVGTHQSLLTLNRHRGLQRNREGGQE